MRRRLLAALPVLALGATAALLVPGGSAAAAPPAGTAGKTYVALGDSYAAGFGLPTTEGTPTGKPVPGCAQTTGDYPHLLAASLGLDLTDVSCSGAVTDDFTSPQHTLAGTAKPQLDIFKKIQPDLVTITIGGNDLGFSVIAVNCLANSGDGPIVFHPTFNACKDFFASASGAAGDPYKRIASTLAKVDAAVKAVQAAAPKAKVVVIAYPAIAPDTANAPAIGCYDANAVTPSVPLTALGFPNVLVGSALPFADADISYLQVLQQQLDDGIGKTAAANGVAYADIYPSSLSHSACAPEADRWVEPIVPAAAAEGATNFLHPNLAGTTAMAAALAPVVTGLLVPTPPTSPPPSSPTANPTASNPTTAVPSTPGATSPTGQDNGTEPLANTGVPFPVTWTVGLATLLLVSGAVAVRTARPRRARH